MAKNTQPDVKLSPRSHRLLASLVASGKFRSTSEAVECALLFLKDQLAVESMSASTLRAKVREGMASVERGEWFEADDVIAEIEALDRRALKRRKSA